MAAHRKKLLKMELKMDSIVQLLCDGLWMPQIQVGRVEFEVGKAPSFLVCKRPNMIPKVRAAFDIDIE